MITIRIGTTTVEFPGARTTEHAVTPRYTNSEDPVLVEGLLDLLQTDPGSLGLKGHTIDPQEINPNDLYAALSNLGLDPQWEGVEGKRKSPTQLPERAVD